MTTPVPDIAATARALRAEGLGYVAIGKRLASMGLLPPSGKPWHDMQIRRMLEGKPGPAPRVPTPPMPRPAPQPPPAPAPQLPALPEDVGPEHEPGTLPWYESQLAVMQAILKRIQTAELGRVDAQGAAAVGRRVEDLAERCRELRAQAATSSTKGQTLEQREQRLGEAAKKMPTPLLEIFAMEWALRNKVDLVELRQARLVRAEEEA